MTNTDPMPVEYRTALAELFAECETRGLGTLHVGFTATPGHEDEAADYIAARADFLAAQRFGGGQ